MFKRGNDPEIVAPLFSYPRNRFCIPGIYAYFYPLFRLKFH